MWRVGNELFDTGVADSCFTRKNAELDNTGYRILIKSAEPLDSCNYIKEDLWQPQAFLGMKLRDFLKVIKTTLLGKEELNKEENLT